VGGLGSVPDQVPLALAAVPDTRRVDHLRVVRRNTTRIYCIHVTVYRIAGAISIIADTANI